MPAPGPIVQRDTQAMLSQVKAQWGGVSDLWVFGYASLIWRPEFEFEEHRPAHLRGYHRALKMWSRVNRGTPECPGLVFALLSGGSCKGIVYRVPKARAAQALELLWEREMPTGVYDPKWLACETPDGTVKALTFTLSRKSPNFTGHLEVPTYRQIFAKSQGRFGSTLDYAKQTFECLQKVGIHDKELGRLLALATPAHAGGPDSP
jgi:cation transport protein ChaC